MYPVFGLETGFCVEIPIKTGVNMINVETVEVCILKQTWTQTNDGVKMSIFSVIKIQDSFCILKLIFSIAEIIFLMSQALAHCCELFQD